MLLLNGSANRDERQFPDGDRFDIHRKIGHHLTLRLRHPLLPRRRAGPPRGPGRARRGAQALPRVGGRLGQRRAGPHLDRPRLGDAPGAHRRDHSRATRRDRRSQTGARHADGRHDPGQHRRPHDRAAGHVREPRAGQVEGRRAQGRPQRQRRRRVGVPGRGDVAPPSAWPPPWAGRRRSGASTPAPTPSCGPAASTSTSGCAT